MQCNRHCLIHKRMKRYQDFYNTTLLHQYTKSKKTETVRADGQLSGIYDYMLLSCYNQKLQSIYRFEYLRSLVTKDKEIINKNTQRYLCGPSRVTDTDARFQSQRPDGGNLTKLKVYQVIFYCCHFWNCENISAWSWMF